MMTTTTTPLIVLSGNDLESPVACFDCSNSIDDLFLALRDDRRHRTSNGSLIVPQAQNMLKTKRVSIDSDAQTIPDLDVISPYRQLESFHTIVASFDTICRPDTPYPQANTNPVNPLPKTTSLDDFYSLDRYQISGVGHFMVIRNDVIFALDSKDLTNIILAYPETQNLANNKVIYFSLDIDGSLNEQYLSFANMLFLIQSYETILLPQSDLPKINQRTIKRTSYRKTSLNSFSMSRPCSKTYRENVVAFAREHKLQNLVLPALQGTFSEIPYTPAPQMNPFNFPIVVTTDNELNESIAKLVDAISKGVDINHNLDPNLTSVLSQITNLVTEKGIPINATLGVSAQTPDIKTIACLTAILAAAIYHYNNPSKETLSVLLALVAAGTLSFGLASLPGFLELGSKISQYISTVSSTVPQMQSSSLDQIITSLVMMFVAHSTGTSKQPWFETILSQVSSFKRNHESFSMCVTSVIKLLETVITFVTRDVLGGETFVFLQSNRTDINEFLAKVTKLSDDIHHNKFAFTSSNALLVHQLWLDCKTLISKIPRGEDNGIILALNNACQYLSSQKKLLDGMNLGFAGSRVEPVSALFVGPPGTGKSTLLMPLSYRMLLKMLPIEKQSQFLADPDSFIYNRQAETVYWDGYNMDKWITFIDDLGQMRDVAGNPDNEWMNWIRMVSSFNYTLHMAALEKKGNVSFQSKVVLANTNLKTFNIESIVSLEAFTRRVDKCYLVVPKLEYCTVDTSKGPLWGRRLDGSKLPIGPLGITNLTPETSDFFEIDAMTNAETGRILTFDQVVSELLSLQSIKQLRFDQSQLYLKDIARNVPQGNDFKVPSGFCENVANNPNKINLNNTLLCSFNHIHGYAASVEFCTQYFLDLFGPSLLNEGKADQEEIEKFRLSMFDLELDEPSKYLPKLQAPKALDRVVAVFQKAQLNLSSMLRDSSNWLLKNSTNLLNYLRNDVSSYAAILTALCATGIVTTIGMAFWNRIEPLFNQAYSGKPQRDRKSQPKRKALSNKDFLSKATQSTTLTPSQQSSSKYDLSNQSIISKIVKRNCYELFLPDQETKLGYVTFLKGRTFIMPKHFATEIYYILEEYPEYSDKLVTFKKSDSHIIFQCSMTDMMNVVSTTTLDSLDTVFIQAPLHFNVHADITKYFMSRDAISKYKILDFCLVLPGCSIIEKWMGKAFPIRSEVITAEVSYSLDKGFKYQAMTKNGDCGGLFTILDNYSGCGKVLGIHVAGSPSTGTGISTCLSHEDVVENLPKDEIQFDFEDDSYPQMSTTILDGRFEEKYISPLKASSATNTKIVKSPLYSTWGPALTCPAKLRPFSSLENGEIDPYKNAISKYCYPYIHINANHIRNVGDMVFDNIVKVSKISVEKRLLTFDESILGIDQEPDFVAISRMTSLGFPDNALPGKKLKGKTAYFGTSDEYDITNEKALQLIEECRVIETKASQNIRTEHIYADCLKDERRPIEKVAQGKTRLFSSCPIRLLILFRRYFGSFMLFCHKNRIENGFAVGVNPYSLEWELIAQKLGRFGPASVPNKGAGDYSGYDGKLKPAVCWDILAHINSWYADEYANIRSILWLEVVNSTHIHFDTVYGWQSSNPSGQPLTTLLNNIYNHYVAGYVWFKTNNFDLTELQHFYDNVYYITLGDDNLFSVNPEKMHLFNEKMMEIHSKDLGMEYTSETKGVVKDAMRPLTEVSFLKRKFRYEKLYDRHCAPLDLSVVLEIPYWITDSSDSHSRVHDNVNTAMKELALHGSEVFDEYSTKIINSYKEHCNSSPDVIRRTVLLRMLQNSVEWY
jgi:hypothetical protein